MKPIQRFTIESTVRDSVRGSALPLSRVSLPLERSKADHRTKTLQEMGTTPVTSSPLSLVIARLNLLTAGGLFWPELVVDCGYSLDYAVGILPHVKGDE